MAEEPALTPGRGPSPPSRQPRRHRPAALGSLLVALAAVVVAIAVAAPHVHRHHTLPPPPPPPKPFRIVFPEGFTRSQMAERVRVVASIARHERGQAVKLNARQYLLATQRARITCFVPHAQRDLEGFLFPATYDFLAKTTSRQLARAQLQAFCRNWASVSMAYARAKNLTPYDVLTIASMVEKEAQVPAERPLIAAVIYNRLHARMPLGIDATLRYALHIPPTASIRESQLQSPTPYNTRLNPGLPPTPIANPGLASIKAAAHPARVDYLFFVRKPDHRHHFFTASSAAFAQYECAHGYGC